RSRRDPEPPTMSRWEALVQAVRAGRVPGQVSASTSLPRVAEAASFLASRHEPLRSQEGVIYSGHVTTSGPRAAQTAGGLAHGGTSSMSSTHSKRDRRENVERNIFSSVNAAGQTVYEIGYRDSIG